MNKYQKTWHTWGLAALIAAFVASNIVWIALDQSPALWDIAGHSQRAALFGEWIRGLHPNALLQYSTIYPPFSYAVTGAGFALFGLHRDIPQYTLILWLVLLMISTYSIAATLYRSRTVALLSTFLLMAFPLVAHFSRIYDLDFQSLAMVAASVAALLKSKHFQKTGWTNAFGVLVALAILTKWTSVLFIAGPALFVLVDSIRLKHFSKATALNLCMAAALTLAIAGPWYWIHGATILESASQTRNNFFSVPYENLWSADNITYYARQIARTVTWPLAIVAGLGGVFMLARRNKSDAFVLFAFVLPYLVMTFVLFSKESRYFLPAFPWVAVSMAVLIAQLRRARWLAGGIIVLIALIAWTETSWGTRLFPDAFYKHAQLESAYGYQTIRPHDPKFGFTQPTQHHTNLHEVPTAIQNDINARPFDKPTINIAVVPNSMFLTSQHIQYEMRLAGLDAPDQTPAFDYSVSSHVRGSDWQNAITGADYLITKTGDQGPPIWGKSLADIANEETNPDSAVFSEFELLHEWPLNGIEHETQTMRLYRKRVDTTSGGE